MQICTHKSPCKPIYRLSVARRSINDKETTVNLAYCRAHTKKKLHRQRYNFPKIPTPPQKKAISIARSNRTRSIKWTPVLLVYCSLKEQQLRLWPSNTLVFVLLVEKLTDFILQVTHVVQAKTSLAKTKCHKRLKFNAVPPGFHRYSIRQQGLRWTETKHRKRPADKMRKQT